jgi:hypothetical protein
MPLAKYDIKRGKWIKWGIIGTPRNKRRVLSPTIAEKVGK